MKSYKHFMAVGLFGLFAIGCLSGGNEVDGKNEVQNPPFIEQQKIYLDSAMVEDLALYKVPCSGHRICVQICHVPPGNPNVAHNKVLPVQATKAHLGHGDYLGFCHGDEGPPNPEEPGDDADEDSGDEAPGDSNDDTDESTNDIPTWCLPFVEYDRDCDGFYDETGDPYF